MSEARKILDLLECSLGCSHYQVQDPQMFLENYCRLVFDGIELPLPGLLHDLYGFVSDRRMTTPGHRVFSGKTFYRDSFFVPFQTSLEGMRVKELIQSSKESDREGIFFYFIKLFFKRFQGCVCDFDSSYAREIMQIVTDPGYINSLGSPDLCSQISYEMWSRFYRSHNPVLRSSDFWELQNIHVIHSEALLFAAREVLNFKTVIEEELKLQLSRVKKYVMNQPEWKRSIAGEYPVGGISEISNRGSLENLLKSELMFVDESEEMDLFQIRFVKNEMLYFKRDSNQIEEYERRIRVYLHCQDTYPSYLTQDVYPFFLFAVLSFWVEQCSEMLPSVRCHFILTYEAKSARDKEYIKIFKALCEPYAASRILSYAKKDEMDDVTDLKKGLTLHIGKKIPSGYCLYWNQSGVYCKTPAKPADSYEDISWICWMLPLFLTGKIPRTLGVKG
jgi:hypothetical protein